MRKSRYNITPPPWVVSTCGFVHYAADIMRISATQLRCKQCGKAFEPPSAERPGSSSIRFQSCHHSCGPVFMLVCAMRCYPVAKHCNHHGP